MSVRSPTVRLYRMIGGAMFGGLTWGASRVWKWTKNTGVSMARANPFKVGLLVALLFAAQADPASLVAVGEMLLQAIAIAVLVWMAVVPKKPGGKLDVHD